MAYATQSALVVRVESTPNYPLGPLFGDMRTWMDHQGVQPIDFKAASRGTRGACFDVFFRHLMQAALFREAFGNVAPAA